MCRLSSRLDCGARYACRPCNFEISAAPRNRLLRLASSASRFVAQRRVLGHHHDLVEERVHRRAQRRQGLQRRRIVAGAEQRLDLGTQRLDLQGELLLGRLAQQRRIDPRLPMCRRPVSGYYGCACWRRPSGFGLRQGAECLQGLEARQHLVEARRIERQHGIDFVGLEQLVA